MSSLFSLTAVPPTLATVSSELTEVSTHILWIFGLLAFLTVILAAYIFRYRGKTIGYFDSDEVSADKMSANLSAFISDTGTDYCQNSRV